MTVNPPTLSTETRTAVDTATAAYHLGRSPQTLRIWACKKNGPLHPVRVNDRLAWPVADLKKLLGVEAQAAAPAQAPKPSADPFSDVQALLKDAARYRWLRDTQNSLDHPMRGWGVHGEPATVGAIESVMVITSARGDAEAPNPDELDAFIDAAMGAKA